MEYFAAKNLAVGYNGKVLIHDIGIEIQKGKVLTLIGPNGAGKSTILKSITRHLAPIDGSAYIDGKNIKDFHMKDFAKNVAVVLTQRIKPELMTCAEVVATGRYPYTGMFGKLTPEDKEAVEKALSRVNALDLAGQDFSTLSDGQRQRIMLARAICQEPEVIVLDEPTAYLDIRHKVELLDILRDMARKENMTVIMSLHEIDLAVKASDFILCVKGDTISAFGTPEEVLSGHPVEELYNMDKGSYDPMFGSVELTRPDGAPRVFVIAGAGKGISLYRKLQKENIPFAAGILFENDLDYPVACRLSDHVVSAPPFTPMTEEQYEKAAELMLSCPYYHDAGTAAGPLNEMNRRLISLAKEKGLKPYGGSCL
ncbi:MAG: ABC transporter ATP-binding protein [Parasporobacterium sp.]|nr:ABC transporter ATP-binding protein [Parasporobacterium sp.]